MSVKRKCKVVMLPTNEKALNISPIVMFNNKLFGCYSPHYSYDKAIFQNLYIISDEEIKEGDWFLDGTMVPKNSLYDLEYELFGKIIATTNNSLMIGFSNKQLNSNYLPKPSQGFIEKFIEEYNKGNVITDVMVEYETPYVVGNYSNKCSICGETFYNTDKLGFICSKHQYLKVNPKDNTIIITKVKDSWSKEEVIKLITKAIDECDGSNLQSKKWIEENL